MLWVKRDMQAVIGLNHVLPKLHERGVNVTLMVNDNIPKRCSSPYLQQMQSFECNAMIKDVLPMLDESSFTKHEIRDAISQGKFCSMKMLSAAYGVPLHNVKKSHSPESLALVKSLQPDVMLNLRNTVIYKPPLINLASVGMFNIHSGELPTYKGLMAAWRAVMAGDSHLRPTLHLIEDAGIDVGAMVGMGKFKVDLRKSFFWHSCFLYLEPLDLFVRTVEKIQSGTDLSTLVTSEHPGTRGSHYYSLPSNADLEEGVRNGFRLFDPMEMVALLQSFHIPQSLPTKNKVSDMISDLKDMAIDERKEPRKATTEHSPLLMENYG